jgi:hypothetical protein
MSKSEIHRSTWLKRGIQNILQANNNQVLVNRGWIAINNTTHPMNSFDRDNQILVEIISLAGIACVTDCRRQGARQSTVEIRP